MNHNAIGKFAIEHGLINENTVRFIYLGYPLLQVRASILSNKDTPTFNLIKKYIYRLVSGDGTDCDQPISYVNSRLQAFQLLGIDKELYNVANYCYDELVLEGKIHDSVNGPMIGAAPPNDPQLSRIRSSRQNERQLIIDPFSADICGQKVASLLGKTETELAGICPDVCCPPPPAYISKPETLEALINQQNFSFENCTEEFMTTRLREQNMPTGAIGVELLQDESYPEIYRLPYYLAMQKTEVGEEFLLYSSTSGKPIDLFPINDESHKSLQDFLHSLFKTQTSFDLDYFITTDVKFELRKKKGVLNSGIKQNKHGSYLVPITDTQLAAILSTNEDETLEALKLLIAGTTVVPGHEAGRLIHFKLTDEQKEVCEKVLADFDCRFDVAFALLEGDTRKDRTTTILEAFLDTKLDNYDAETLYLLGVSSFMGRGTEKNYEKAFEYFERAAKKGYEPAFFQQGLCYLYGCGVEVDLDAAFECWSKIENSKSRFYSLAMHNIAFVYMRKADFENAFKTLNKITDLDFVCALSSFTLGHLYQYGKGVEKNLEEAAKHYEAAAKHNHIAAYYELAKLYINGLGVEKDTEKAKELLEKAIQPCPEERILTFGVTPFTTQLHRMYPQEELENRRELLENIQNAAKKLL